MAIEHDLPGFDELAAILRRGPSDVADETPPASLWAAIEAEVAAETAGAGRRVGAARGGTGRGGAEVVDLATRRRIRLRVATAVAAVAAVVLVGVPAALSFRSSQPDAVTEIAALPGYEGIGGRAELDGRDLEVDLTGLQPTQGEFYEVWLLDLDGGTLKDLVALGTIDATGRFTINPDVDLKRFNTVDVSIEPDDGNPAHSGKSVARGELPPLA